MGVFASQIKRFLKEDQGQATTEYILILSFSVITAAAINRQIIKTIKTGLLSFGSQLETDLKTGKSSVSIWDN